MYIKCDCRWQEWDSRVMERIYTACLVVVLLILPLVVMTTTYGLISYKLWPRGGASEGGIGTRSQRRTDLANGQSDCATYLSAGDDIVTVFFWHFRIYFLGNWIDLNETWQTDGGSEKSNLVGFHAGSLQWWLRLAVLITVDVSK